LRIKKIAAAVFAVYLGLTLTMGPALVRSEVVDRIVAVVNGELITLFELNQRVKPYLERFRGKELGRKEKEVILKMKKDVLNKMIEDILIKQRAEEYGIEVTDMEVQNRIRQIKNRNQMTEEELRRELKRQGMSMEEFSKKIREDILKHRLISAMVKRKVVVTDEEIEEYYKKHKADFRREKKVKLNLILLPDSVKAKEIFEKIKQGKISFAKAAAEYSVGPQPDKAGDLGYVDWASMNADFKEALKNKEAGDIAPPFEFKDKAALLKVRDIQSGETRPLSEVKDKISDQIYKKKFSRQYEEYLSQLREKAIIDIRL